MSVKTSRDMSLDASIAIIAAMHRLFSPKVTPDEAKQERRRQQRWANAVNILCILFGFFEWQYFFLPIGIRRVVYRYGRGDLYLTVYAQQLHVFGFRIARWVTSSEVHHGKEIFIQEPVMPRRNRMRRHKATTAVRFRPYGVRR